MLVWLTDWQLAEDHVLITVGDTVEWELSPTDADWMSRLLGDGLAIDVRWQFDTDGDAVEVPSRAVRGVVADLRAVRCRTIPSPGGRVPAPGETRLHPVSDTSGSWRRAPGPHTVDDELYGYLATLHPDG